jgi:creatine kinase
LAASRTFGLRYFSLTPGHPQAVSQQSLATLLKHNVLFDPLVARPDFRASGVAGHWPYGRGCYASTDKTVAIWVGAEDHIQASAVSTP